MLLLFEMTRANLPFAFFFAGAAIFCAAGWTSESLAAWAAQATPEGETGGAPLGTAVGALLGKGSATSPSAPRASLANNGIPSTAPQLAAPMGFDRSTKRVRELDSTDPWSGDRRTQASGMHRMELENADPWSPSATQGTRIARARLLLDESDPWTGILPK